MKIFIYSWIEYYLVLNPLFTCFGYLLKAIDFTYLWNITWSTRGTPWGFVILENIIRRWKKIISCKFYLRRNTLWLQIYSFSTFQFGHWLYTVEDSSTPQPLQHSDDLHQDSGKMLCRKCTLATNYCCPLLLVEVIFLHSILINASSRPLMKTAALVWTETQCDKYWNPPAYTGHRPTQTVQLTIQEDQTAVYDFLARHIQRTIKYSYWYTWFNLTFTPLSSHLHRKHLARVWNPLMMHTFNSYISTARPFCLLAYFSSGNSNEEVEQWYNYMIDIYASPAISSAFQLNILLLQVKNILERMFIPMVNSRYLMVIIELLFSAVKI